MPFDHFNAIAGFYDRAGTFSWAEPMAGLLSITPDNRVLDAGGGTGRVANVLRELVHSVVIADASPGMLRQAIKKGLPAVNTPIESLPFPAESFDRIIMIDALHHVLSQVQTTRELWRVLARGGRLLIVEPDIQKFSVKLLALMEKVLLMRSHFLSAEKMVALFENPDADVSVVHEDYTAYILIKKS
jgi:ubiquinone/menaquinone biosynthesis C-methylase UbiE